MRSNTDPPCWCSLFLILWLIINVMVLWYWVWLTVHCLHVAGNAMTNWLQPTSETRTQSWSNEVILAATFMCQVSQSQYVYYKAHFPLAWQFRASISLGCINFMMKNEIQHWLKSVDTHSIWSCYFFRRWLLLSFGICWPCLFFFLCSYWKIDNLMQAFLKSRGEGKLATFLHCKFLPEASLCVAV